MKVAISRSKWIAACFVAVLALAACQSASQAPAPSPPTPTAENPSTSTSSGVGAAAADAATRTAPTPQPTAPSAPVATPQALAVSQESLYYARSIGGVSQQGRTLYFIVGTSVATEAEARAGLNRAIPLFGDMQSYFIVQRSDNFDGMKPGWWIVAEAYAKPPSADNLAFGKRAFKQAYVRRAVVHTTDPIPVYEDLVPGSN